MKSPVRENSLEIGVVMDFPDPDVVAGVRSYCDENGIAVDARWSVRGDWVVKEPGWDGVIYKIASYTADALRERVKGWQIKKVSLLPDGENDLVSHDYYLAGGMAADEFMASGVQRVLVLNYSSAFVDNYYSKGCMDQLYRMGASPKMLDTEELEAYGVSGVVSLVLQEIKKESFPLGLCSAHAGIMMSVEKALLAEGYRIPEDVQAVVLDKDIQETSALSPVPMTGIVLDSWMQGYVAAEMLHKRLAGEEVKSNQVYITPKGIKRRESTGHLSENDPVMAKALSFIRANYTQAIGVSDVVEAVGASRRVVEMRFREILDRGIGEEINRLRMEAAKRLLKEKKYKVAEIADMAGFSSLHYFSAAFKRQFGCSPRAYQTRQGGSSGF
ncbi:HTH-type transcriptional activator RhaR [Rubritalea halochordaticola]|uniref:HTH-type transcriptional activator RhaR n=1 Tax=Rubritalea halochordaticola TaxID=714537 RepID=A0ABP9V452_9BACT